MCQALILLIRGPSKAESNTITPDLYLDIHLKHLCAGWEHNKNLLNSRLPKDKETEKDKNFKYYKAKFREILQLNFTSKFWSLDRALMLFDQGFLSYEPYSIMVQELALQAGLEETDLVKLFGPFYSKEALAVKLYENSVILTEKNIEVLVNTLSKDELQPFYKVLSQQPVFTIKWATEFQQMGITEKYEIRDLYGKLANAHANLSLESINASLEGHDWKNDNTFKLRDFLNLFFTNKTDLLELYLRESKANTVFKFFEIVQLGDKIMFSYFREES